MQKKGGYNMINMIKKIIVGTWGDVKLLNYCYYNIFLFYCFLIF